MKSYMRKTNKIVVFRNVSITMLHVRYKKYKVSYSRDFSKFVLLLTLFDVQYR